MKQAIGLIETKGLAAAVAAADKALKSANILLEGKEITEPGYVTIRLTGELSEIQLAVAAGTEAARDTGELISSIVIADPSAQLSILFGNTRITVQREDSSFLSASKQEEAVTEPVEETIRSKNEIPVNKETVRPKKQQVQIKRAKPAAKKEITIPAVVETDIRPAVNEDNHKEVDTITRLRMEALGKKFSDAASADIVVKEDSPEDLNSMNVHKLRRLARNTSGFPIHGREISKANRDVLLQMFNVLGLS